MTLEKSFDEINESDLKGLIDNQISERKNIEYKEILPENKQDSKKEFLADVSSFANTSGGHIFYGIKEKDGLPVAIPGIANSDLDSEILRLENLLRDSIQPRISGVSIGTINLESKNSVIVIRVPQSWAKPHVVNHQGHWRFYARNSAGKYPLDVLELKSAFLATTALGERIRDFHFDRTSKIVSDETPVQLADKARIILHTIPYSAFDSSLQFNVHLLEKDVFGLLNPIYTSTSGYRYNLDGLITYGSRGDGPARAYLQIFRNGITESVNTSMFRPIDSQYFIPTRVFEDEIIKAIKNSISIYQKLSITPPFVIMMTITGVKGYKLGVGNKIDPWKDHINVVDRDHLLLPDIVVEDFSGDIPALLRPIFDAVWNSAGWQKSLGYNEEGEWGKGPNFLS